MSLAVTDSLREALAQLYYQEACDQNGWAYVSLKDLKIHDNVVMFRKGYQQVGIKLQDKIVQEIKKIVDANSKERPVFDYLSCKVRHRKKYEGIMIANPTALTWVQVKAVKNGFSAKQIDVLEEIKIPLALFYIRDVLTKPQNVEVRWDIRTGEEWLDELDDIRDQAESDDDYL